MNKQCCESYNGVKDTTNSCIFCKTYIPRNTENITDADKGIVHFGGESKEEIEAEDRWHDELMTYTDKRLDINWQEVPNQIGLTLNIGTHTTYIESKLNDEERKGIRNLIEFSITQAIAEERERMREYLSHYKTKSDCCSQTVDDIYTNLSSLDINNLKK